MSGTFVCVVGPSGAGKDTLIAGARSTLADDSRYVFPRRVVTRDSSAAEDHETIAPERFQAIELAGHFALSWQAHGLSYAIPGSVLDDLARGRIIVCNLSRKALAEAGLKFPRCRTILVTAPREVLRERLLARGRESAIEIDARLDREVVTAVQADLIIGNVGPVEDSVGAVVGFLREIAAEPAHRAADREALAS